MLCVWLKIHLASASGATTNFKVPTYTSEHRVQKCCSCKLYTPCRCCTWNAKGGGHSVQRKAPQLATRLAPGQLPGRCSGTGADTHPPVPTRRICRAGGAAGESTFPKTAGGQRTQVGTRGRSEVRRQQRNSEKEERNEGQKSVTWDLESEGIHKTQTLALPRRVSPSQHFSVRAALGRHGFHCTTARIHGTPTHTRRPPGA